jgi:hypothetical protein
MNWACTPSDVLREYIGVEELREVAGNKLPIAPNIIINMTHKTIGRKYINEDFTLS